MADNVTHHALGDRAGFQLANVTKTPPQYGAITPRWLVRLLDWKPLEAGTLRVNRRAGRRLAGRIWSAWSQRLPARSRENDLVLTTARNLLLRASWRRWRGSVSRIVSFTGNEKNVAAFPVPKGRHGSRSSDHPHLALLAPQPEWTCESPQAILFADCRLQQTPRRRTPRRCGS